MFQRQAKQPYSPGLILLMALAVLAFLILLYIKSGEQAQQPAPQTAPEASGNGGLRPAEWYFTIREYPDFHTDLAGYTTALELAREEAEYAARPRGGDRAGFSAPWTLEGPSNIGARVNSIALHPTNPSIVYVGFSGGGLWKTTNGGLSWIPLFDKQTFLSIGDVELDPQNPNIVYACTGDPNISAYPFIGDGLWKSTDGGATWKHLGLTNQRILSKIIVHPTNSNVLYVAAMGLPFERNKDRGLYKSTDGGKTWQQSLFVSDQSGVIDLEMSPANPNVLYAAVWDRIRNNRESLVRGQNARIWKTLDGGANWTVLQGGLPQDEKSRIGLSIDAKNAQHLLALYGGADLQFHSVHESFDGGQSWTQNPVNGLDANFMFGMAWYFGKIHLNPHNPLDIWILGVNSYRSTDGGKTWARAVGPNKGVHADHHDMAFISATNMLIGTDGGLYQSTDNGVLWRKIENIPATQFYRVAHNPHKPTAYYGGAQDNGTLTGNALKRENWQEVFGGDGFQAVFHPNDPNIFYYEYQNGEIRGTVNGGDFFNDATKGIEATDRRSWDMQYLISPNNPDAMYSGTYRAYRGTGHPPVWEAISPDLTDGDVYGARFHVISALDESRFDPNLLYYGTSDGNLWRGNPSNRDWININTGLPDRYVSAVKASPNHPDRVFVAFTGYRANDFAPRLYRSDNRGQNWTSIAGNLPDLAINDLLVLPGHKDSLLFVATDGGVYGTTDGGKTWDRLGADMPVVPVFDLDLNPAGRRLIAGSHARSIYTFPLDSLRAPGDVSTVDLGGNNRPLLTVNPSPAIDRAFIGIQNLKSQQYADLFISDFSGRTIWQGRVQGFQTEKTEVDVRRFPAGIYIAYALSNGKVWGRQKFVVGK
jgi:photosystem II stability/assembly factor-like uncharacterized protein